MKLVYIAAGAGGMYCGSCLHDNTLAATLIQQGIDVMLVPTYTPLRTDETSVSEHRVFFGGVNVYLQQKLALFRHTPAFFDRLLDSPALINWLVERSVSTRPEDLGGLVVSMLQGEQGRQRKELAKLVDWLARDARPDVVHLSNSMLSGMAGAIKRRLGVPVVCTLSGEDIFLEGIPEPYYSQAREELARHAADVDHFVALNNYYADFSAEYLQVPRGRIDVIPHGLRLEGHGNTPIHRSDGSAAADRVRTIGFLARICPEKGLHQLVEAFGLLLADESLPPLRLLAAGYLSAAERPYLEGIQQTVSEHGFADRFEYVGELDRAAKIAFLQSLDVMGLPTVYRESKGLSVLEAMANGVPVVLPRHGAFPEVIEATGGGLLCEPDDPQSLADELRRVITDDALGARCGQSGYDAVRQQFTADLMSRRTLALYNRLLDPTISPTAVKSVGVSE